MVLHVCWLSRPIECSPCYRDCISSATPLQLSTVVLRHGFRVAGTGCPRSDRRGGITGGGTRSPRPRRCRGRTSRAGIRPPDDENNWPAPAPARSGTPPASAAPRGTRAAPPPRPSALISSDMDFECLEGGCASPRSSSCSALPNILRIVQHT